MNCPYCGDVMNGDELFCGNCGAKINQQQYQQPQQHKYQPEQMSEQAYDFSLFETGNHSERQSQHYYGMNESAEHNVRPSVNKLNKSGMSKTAKIIIPVVAVVLVAAIVVLALVLPQKESDKNSDLEGNPTSAFYPTYNFASELKNSTLVAGEYNTFAVTYDGKIKSAGQVDRDIDNYENWSNIVSVAIYDDALVALKSDGTTYSSINLPATNLNAPVDHSEWTDIVQVAAGSNHVVGLKKDGTVVAGGDNLYGQCMVDDWKDIVYIDAGRRHTVGVKNDGTVVAVGDSYYDVMEVDGWRDIVKISSGDYLTLGLKSDGTVVSTPYEEDGEVDVSGWRDIIDLSVGCTHAVGLKSDGTVVFTGSDSNGRTDVGSWTDIIQVSAGGAHTVGLKSDGQIVTTGYNRQGQCDVEDWHNIMIPFKNFMNFDYSKYEYPVIENTNPESNVERLEVRDSDLERLQDILNYNWLPLDTREMNTVDVMNRLRTIFGFWGYQLYFDDGEYIPAYRNTEYIPDPLERFAYGHAKLKTENIRWICENIYHTEFDENFEFDEAYCYGDYVYCLMGEAGGGESPSNYIVDYSRLEDGRYEITVNLREDFVEPNNDLGNYTVIADIQMLNGQRHWTFYSISDTY